MPGRERALIVGAGSGLSASLARRAAREGMDVVLAARNTPKLAALAAETGATAIACDAARAARSRHYNASGRARGAITELDPRQLFPPASPAAQRLGLGNRAAPWVETF